MLQYDWEQSVGCWVVTTAQALRRAMNAELAKQGITLRQWEVLAWLAMEGELSQAELAERLGIEAPTLVGILDRMQRDGWLDRYPCPQDRRKKRIRSTGKSETLWLRMVECARTVRSQATQGFHGEELTMLKLMCEKIRANLNPAQLPPDPYTDDPESTDAAATRTTSRERRKNAPRPAPSKIPVDLFAEHLFRESDTAIVTPPAATEKPSARPAASTTSRTDVPSAASANDSAPAI